jgi:UDP-N-acetylglucosamine--N-acetylmuramyl-(pentapeptide) pyrophosphoryl-undecaprenol N-acetylglucosamine transferase
VTGNPVREDRPEGRKDLRAEYGIPAHQKVLFVFGGSQGSRPINNLMRALLPPLLGEGGAEVLWQTGKNDYESLRSAFEGIKGVRIFPFIDNIYDFYRCADFAVCRAGALTIAELSLFGLPALLIPLPTAAADHQTSNARRVEDAGGGLCVPQEEAPEKLPALVRSLLSDPGRLDRMRRNMASLRKGDAAQSIADELIKEMDA